MNIFDETYFEFRLTGGSKNTEIIQAEAIILKGQYKGQSLPLRCQWFNITRKHDFHEIEGVTGAFYQPSLEDVDTKIRVQAVPILESQEYQGMPVFKETAYIAADEQIQETVNQVLQDVGKLEMNCRIEHTNIGQLPFPNDALMTIQDRSFKIEIKESNLTLNYAIDENYPNVKIQRKTTNGVEIQLNSQDVISVKLLNNFSRDVTYQMVKTLRGKAQIHLQDNNQEEGNSALYAKVADYTKTIEEQKKLINELNQKIQELNTTTKDQQQKINLLQASKQKVEDSCDQLGKKLEQQVTSNQKLQKKALFYEQEVNLLKTQLLQVENTNKQLKSQYQELSKLNESNQDKIQEAIYKEREEIFQREINTLKQEVAYFRAKQDEHSSDLNQQIELIRQLQEEKELNENEILSLRKKCDSLVHEQTSALKRKDRSVAQSGSPSPKSEVSGTRVITNFQDFTEQMDKSEELRSLRNQVASLEQALRNLRVAYEADKVNLKIANASNAQNLKNGKLWGFGGGNSQSSQQEIILRKLANDLSETIAEKDMTLENLKNINKDLMRRIQEMERR